MLGCVLGLAAAIAFRGLRLPLAIALALAVAMTGGFAGIAPFREACEAHELPPERVALFRTQHGVGPTDEYTPTDADNDQLRWDDPAYWLASNPNAPGPNTVPNPAATIENYDEPPPLDQTVSGRAPMHLALHLQQPEDLILNLRDYPAWRVTINGNSHPQHLQRDDGLLALPLPAGEDTVDVRWRRLPDMWIGDAISLLALLAATWLRLQSRKIRA